MANPWGTPLTRIIAAMLSIFLALVAAVVAPGVAHADGKVVVPLPDLSGISDGDAEKMIAALAQINVITSNCPDYAITDGEWTLLVGTGDMLAQKLGLDPDSYERRFYGPAFRLLNDPGACDRIGPRARPIIDDLIRMGGGTHRVRE